MSLVVYLLYVEYSCPNSKYSENKITSVFGQFGTENKHKESAIGSDYTAQKPSCEKYLQQGIEIFHHFLSQISMLRP